MKKMVLAIALLLCAACSSDNEETQQQSQVTTSAVSTEYLTSVLFWYAIPETGIPQGKTLDDYERYTFLRMGSQLSGTYKQGKSYEPEAFTYSVAAPSVELTFTDTGKTKTLAVYKLNKTADNAKYLQINGVVFTGMANGIDM